MFEEAVKKQVMAKILDKQQEHLLKQIKAPKATFADNTVNLDSNKPSLESKGAVEGGTGVLENVKETIQDTFTPVRKKTMITLAGDYDGWHYGLKYELAPDILMKRVMETLVELNTTYISRSSSYKITCFHHIYRDFPILTPDPNFEGSLAGSLNQPNGKPTTAPAKPVADKFSKEELGFNVRIFLLEKDSNEYVIDVHRTRGHSIVFLNYCQKFVQVLHNNLSKS